MQNVKEAQNSGHVKDVKTVEVDEGSSAHSSSGIEKAQILTNIQQNFMELSASEEDEVSEVRQLIKLR